MGDFLGGKTESKAELPPWLAEASQDAIAQAQEIAQIGYVPYYGPEVAAFNQMQQGAMQNTADMLGSYGMNVPGMDIPTPQTFAGGVQGYSSAPIFEEAIAALQANRPGQYNAIQNRFIDPMTGNMPGAEPAPVAPGPTAQDMAAQHVTNFGYAPVKDDGTAWYGPQYTGR